MSNVLGTINPVAQLAEAAHAAGALILVDGAQQAPQLPTDVAAMGVDFFGLTGHKMLGPTGIGALWARSELLEAMPAFLGGGEMIRDVRLDSFTTNDVPWKFEAGTPPIAEAVGLTAAVEYLTHLGMTNVRAHEQALTSYALGALRDRYRDLVIYGPLDPAQRGGVISFNYKDVHPHDLSQVLDEAGVCVRAGHHCAKPLMRGLGVGATARASFSVYNDEADVDALVDALATADRLFS
jgi:cysteine desulfurase/selenocysteine lyase